MAINRLSQYNFAISQSISGSFNANDTVEATFLAKGNSSVANQYVTQFVDLKYSVSSESISLQEFPKGTFPEQFFVGSNYTTQSFTAGIPEEIQYVQFTLTGSLNGTGSNTYNSGGNANYQRSLQLDYDAFELKVHTPKTELTDSGLLVFTSPSKFIKADSDGITIKGGNIDAEKITARELEVFGDTTIFGDITSTANSPYNSTPQNISNVGSAGASALFARGDHQHNLPFATLDAVVQESEFTNISGSSTSTGSFGNIQIPDDGQINLGNENDLQIFHRAGVYSRIKDSGTGPLQFSSNRFKFMASDNSSVMIDATSGGAVDLYHNNNKKLETTIGGINVTGNITASENISGSGTGSFTGGGIFGGNVGINTTTPTYKLEVKNTAANAELGITGGNTDARLVLTSNESTWLVQNDYSNAGALSFYNGTGGHTLVIAEAGNVGIGVTDPAAALEVNGDIYVQDSIQFGRGANDWGDAEISSSGETLTLADNTNVDVIINKNSADDDGYFSVRANTNKTTIMRVSSSGNVGIGTSTPVANLDIRDGHIKVGEQNIYASNTDQPYLIVADDDHYTGETTNWGTYGMQHRIKSNAGGSPRLTIDSLNGELFSVGHTGNVGILTSSPGSPLEVIGNISSSATGKFNKVGIGTSPSNNVSLDVRGDALFTGKRIYFAHDGGDPGSNNDFIRYSDAAWQTAGGVLSLHADQARNVGTGSVNMALFADGIYSSGNVGIGTANPGEALEVDGNISASGTLRVSSILDANDAGASSTLSVDAQGILNIGTTQTDDINIGRQDNAGTHINLYANSSTPSIRIINQTIKFNNHITASGNISSSGGTQHYLGGKLSIGQNTGTTTTEGVLQVAGDIYGKKVDGQYSELKRFGGLYFTWDGDSYGTNKYHSIRSTEDNTYTDSLTFNSYDKMMFNLDSNDNNNNSYFRISHHGTGSSDGPRILNLDDESNFTLYRSGSSTAGAGTINFHIDGTAGNITASGEISASGRVTTLQVGKDSTDQIDFSTDNVIIFKTNNSNRLRLTGTALRPNSAGGIDLGNTSNPFDNLHLQGDITASGNISASGTHHTLGGKLGIGTSTPVASGLEVRGELGIHDGSGAVHTQMYRETGTGGITFKRVNNSDGSDNGGEFIKAKYGEFIVTGEISSSGDLTISDGTRALQYDVSAHALKSSGATLDINGTDISFNTDDLFIDQSNSRIGIGTTTPITELEIHSANSEAYHYPLVLRNPYNNETNLDYGVGIKFHLDDANDNKFGSIAYEAQTSYANIGNLKFYVDQNDNTTPIATMTTTGLGIGTTSPDNALHISSSGNAIVKLESSGDGNFDGSRIYWSNGVVNSGSKAAYFWMNAGRGSDAAGGAPTFGIQRRGSGSADGSVPTDVTTYHGNILTYREGQHAQSGWLFATPTHTGSSSTTNRFFISSSGNIGVGTITPDYKLDVNGNMGINDFIYHNGDDNTYMGFNGADDIEISAGGNHLNFDTTGLGIGVTATEKFDVDGNIKARGNISSPTFESGFAGSGYRITSGSDGKQSLTIDEITVRGSMSVYELLIHQIRATNGSLFVSNTAKLSGSVQTSNYSESLPEYELFFDTGSGYGHSFQVGDLIRAQRFVPSTNGSGSTVFKSDLHITSVDATGSAVGVLTGSDVPQPGYEYVRIGSTTSADRQGAIYLTADDENAPFIDVIDKVTAHSQFNTSGKVKTRIGKLDGITTSKFGTLEKYGFYASGSAYLEGSINATAGEIGGFTINSTSISASNLFMKSSGQITGSDVLFDGGTIGGFKLGEDGLADKNGTPRLVLSASGNIKVGAGITIDATGDSNSGRIQIGNKVQLNGSSNSTIGGFTISQTEFTSGDFKLNSANESLQLGTVTDLKNDGSNTGVFASGSGEFFFGKEQGDFISFVDDVLTISSSDIQVEVGDLHITASDIDMTTDTFNLNANSGDLLLDSANRQISLANGNIKLDGDSNSTNGHILVGNLSGPSDTATSNTGVYLVGNGLGLIKAATDNYIKFDNSTLEIKSTNVDISGSSVNVQTPSFFFGSATNNISSSNDDLSITTKNLTASGSSVEFQTPNFFLGTATNNISSSNNDLSITTKDLTASGSSVKILTPNFFLGSTTNNISSSNDDLTITTKNLTASGSNVNILTNNFFLGSATNNISSSNDDLSITTKNLTASGSSVDIQTPSFFLGNQSKFISGSGNDIEISSSGFHLKRDGSAIMSGSITAKQGTIGGFTLTDNLTAGTFEVNPSTPSIKLGTKESIVDDGGAGEDTGIFMTPSALVIGPQKYDSGDSEFSGFRVLSSGVMTASKAKIMGDSEIAGFDITDSEISSQAGTLKLKASGQITGSNVLFNGGVIGGFEITDTQISASEGGIIISSSGEGELAGGSIKFDKFGNLDITDARLKISNNGFQPDAFNAATGKFVDMLPDDGNVQVVAFEDNTIVTRVSQSGEIRDTLVLSASQVSTNMSDRRAGDIYDANKPIFAYNTTGAPLAPLSAVGKTFLTMCDRDNPFRLHFFSPFGDAKVHIASGSNNSGVFDKTLADITVSQSLLTTQDGITAINDFDEFYQITSSLPIVVSAVSLNVTHSAGTTDEIDSGNTDRIYIPPVSKEVFIPSDTGPKTLEGSSNQTISNINSTYYFSDSPFALYNSGDGAGSDAEHGLPIEMLGDTYVVPHSLADYRMTAVEPGVVEVYRVNAGEKILYQRHFFESSSKTEPTEIEVGNIAGSDSSELFDAQSVRFEGTMPFFLRVNDTDGEDEYPVLGYRRTQTSQYQNSTTIEGDRIRTGKIQSNNLSTTAGSEFNLDDGTFKLGGTSDPTLQFNGTSLKVSGSITASSGIIGGFETTATQISASGLVLKSSGQITASSADLSGKITATSGIIGGDGGWTIKTGEIESDDNEIKLLSISGSTAIGGAQISQSIVIGSTAGVVTTLGQTLTKVVPNPNHGLRTTGKKGFSIVEFTNILTPVKEYVRLDEEVRHISNWNINEENILSSGSNGKNNGIEIHSTQGIFGHGNSSTKETLSHAGMFKFTEDTISAPGGSDGNSYDLTTDELVFFGGAHGTDDDVYTGGTE